MNKQEATQLLALIKVAYPTAYRDLDAATKKATVNMWAMSFPDVPFPIMEQALAHFRMTSKFPPTVAEMVEELKEIHNQAMECALIHKNLGNDELVKQFRAIMDYTYRYKDSSNFGLQLGSLTKLLSGGGYDDVQRLGTPGDYEMPSDRLSLMDGTGRG
jgi:hypothetical protein